MRRKNETSDTMMDYMVEALLLLMKEKSYDRIKVGEITERAGVDRTTYYRHFHSKEEILERYLRGLNTEFMEEYRSSGKPDFQAYTLIIFQVYYAHREELLLIFKAGCASLLLPVLEEGFHFEEYRKNASVKKQYEVSYIIGGIYNNLLFWLSRDMRETPEEMSAIALSYRPEGSLTMLNASRIPV